MFSSSFTIATEFPNYFYFCNSFHCEFAGGIIARSVIYIGKYATNRIQKAFDNAAEIPVGNLSRIVIMSDCHRGCGSNADNLMKNKNIYLAALSHYFKDGYTCIELGDGDELWENRNFEDIVEAHLDVFKLLAKFHEQNRFFMVYGNHDIVKKSGRWVKENMFVYYDTQKKQLLPLLPNIKVHEAVVLKHKRTGGKTLLLHGHQADFFNGTLYPLARFLVRYLWRPLETIGATDPASAAKNNVKKHLVEENLIGWLNKTGESGNKAAMIAGHTHRSMFPEAGEPAYFNDGCCVYAGMITTIEIQNGMIYLVKWSVQVRGDGVLSVMRGIIGGPVPLEKFFTVSETELEL